MKDLDPPTLLMAFEYMLSSLLSMMETKRAYITSQIDVEASEKLNDATVKLYQALSDIEAARKL